jgi:hypothetical protein
MPKKDIDYSTTIIYKISCNDESISDLYVGHTTNFVQRKHAHKLSCTNIKSSNYKCKLYSVIRNNGGWDNWKMEILNFFNCKDHYEARKKEQEYFILLKATLNSIEPLPTPKPKEVTPKEVAPKVVTPNYEDKKEKNEKKVISCEVCHVKFNTEKLLEDHNGTKKHKNKMNNTTVESYAGSFCCKYCHFKCSKQSDYERHILTRKHKNRTNSNNIEQDFTPPTIFTCKNCNKEYKARTSLWYHEKKCKTSLFIKKDNTITMENNNGNNNGNNNENNKLIDDVLPSDNNITITSEMFMALIKNSEEMMKVIKEQQEQIKEQQEQIITIIPKIGNTTNNNNNNTTNNNTTNNFNLNVFLNEHCKDALNMSDFIDSLKITLEDLLFSKTNGISRGITDVMIKGLKELDIHKRPIHCTDIKREIMYIKDEDKWSKDDNHDMIKNTIVKIADKERTALQQWALDNPHWMETERKQLDYLTMVRSICEPIENYDNYEKKILKNLGKEIQIDKKT